MPNLMQNGATWLGERLKDVAGVTVRIELAGAVLVAEITATPSAVMYEVPNDEGFLQEVKVHDWEMTAADLGGATLRDGARIIDGDGVEYEILPVGKRPSVELLDTSGILLLVHSKKVT